MDFVRIGEKLINRNKLLHKIDQILELRVKGLSQQETAEEVGVDRTFVSRLETLGEVRKGGKIALIGFPIKNKDEIQKVAEREGVDFIYLLTNSERWNYVKTEGGLEILNHVISVITRLREHDLVIFLGSNMRLKEIEEILGNEVVGIEIGESPIAEDKFVDPEELAELIRKLKK
ncbi:MAG: transcriptional regulator [Firmicutes bacterium]|nr:transcriptional regulator [Bacillota bacterium]